MIQRSPRNPLAPPLEEEKSFKEVEVEVKLITLVFNSGVSIPLTLEPDDVFLDSDPTLWKVLYKDGSETLIVVENLAYIDKRTVTIKRKIPYDPIKEFQDMQAKGGIS